MEASSPGGTGSACSPSGCPADAPSATLPADDPFYRYPVDLSGQAPGTVLKSRPIALGILASGPGLGASQVLYRTTGELGQPAATVATIIEQRGRGRLRGVVSYQDPYDGLGPQCDPSYNLRAGVAPVDRVVTPTVIGEYVAAGFAVVVPDYEQEQFVNGAGQEEGYATLDGVRAAEHRLGAPEASTPVGLAGFSGGATATDYATELAPTYAPELDIVGAAEGGVAVDYVHNIDYVNGSPDWSEVVPAALVGSAGRSASTSTSTCRRSGRRSPLRSLVPAWAAWPCPRRRSTSCSSPSTATFRRARVQAHVQPAHHEQDRNPERAGVACQWQF